MKIFLYSVKDTAAGYSQPFAAASDAVALRMFIGSVRSQTPNIANTYPEDKTFWKVGELDTETGIISAELKCLAAAADYAPSAEDLAKRELAEKAARDDRVLELEQRLAEEATKFNKLFNEFETYKREINTPAKKKRLFGGKK